MDKLIDNASHRTYTTLTGLIRVDPLMATIAPPLEAQSLGRPFLEKLLRHYILYQYRFEEVGSGIHRGYSNIFLLFKFISFSFSIIPGMDSIAGRGYSAGLLGLDTGLDCSTLATRLGY
uniref:Uncharacterized protein n=1 Tax=Picea glauca TaxID=3330 RepID=A0A101M0Q2_PICGL|nr:hypothetical protein ABT39_MTgene4118 [Picea glauca]QHR92566.1 hypothetical protein Q903MT_gene6612 [Picea sitchensis]